HGKGFAVVAEEVKKLAGQSVQATDKITAMIKEIQNKTKIAVSAMGDGVKEVDEGVITIEDVGHSLEQILQAAKITSNHIQEVSNEVNNLAKNSDNAVKMMNNISSITQEITANTEDISSITEESAASAEEISSITQESAASAEEISSITEEQTASVEEISASAQSLAKIAENLQKFVAVFKA
ncbi:MAG: methyl-accepting chemotaxis protein, partial [bacterium]